MFATSLPLTRDKTPRPDLMFSDSSVGVQDLYHVGPWNSTPPARSWGLSSRPTRPVIPFTTTRGEGRAVAAAPEHEESSAIGLLRPGLTEGILAAMQS